MVICKLDTQDKLPLTCTRTGTCCHGKLVLLNPWELACLAKEKKNTPKEFYDRYCEDGGIRLQFNGNLGWRNQKTCSQYIEHYGCSVHQGRPLSCRLFPLGRQIQNGEVVYMYQGNEFPCLDGCPEVTAFPHLSVEEYLNEQLTAKFEKAQDEYLIVMQNIADIAFELLLDSGMVESKVKETLQQWRKLGCELPETLAERIGHEWIEILMLPKISEDIEDPIVFTQKHNHLLQIKVQEKFGALQNDQEIHQASVQLMGVALHLARGIGADPKILAEHWIETAKNHGAME